MGHFTDSEYLRNTKYSPRGPCICPRSGFLPPNGRPSLPGASCLLGRSAEPWEEIMRFWQSEHFIVLGLAILDLFRFGGPAHRENQSAEAAVTTWC